MEIAQEEIFGPVLSIIPYEDIDNAVQIANDTSYGLSAYVCGSDSEKLRSVARQIRAGQIHVNYGSGEPMHHLAVLSNRVMGVRRLNGVWKNS